jgi:hypothetical protein
MTKNITLIYLIFIITPVLFQSCQKEKAENSLEGNWIVNSTKTRTVLDTIHPLVDSGCGDLIIFSGELFLNEYGNGHAKIYGTFCDTTRLLFDKSINDLIIGTHHADMDFSKGYRIHWYQGYFNEDIYFSCSSCTDRGKIESYTNEINFSIGALINQNTGAPIEDYSLNLVLTRQ